LNPVTSTMTAEKKSNPPDWFTRAVSTPFEDRFLEVEGSRIHYLRWGQAGKPGLLLVHGGYAHAHWWDFIAPFFGEDHCVAALDLSGMGESGYRRKYTAELYAKEVMSVCADAGFERPVLVGHSFGGFVVLKAAALYGDQLMGIVVADFPFRPPDLQQEHDAKRRRSKPKQIYPTFEAALARFRLIPPQPCENQFILDHIAHRSLTQVDGGWTWKFDDYLFDGFELGDIAGDLAKATCRVAAVYGEHSALFPPEVVKHTTGLLGNRVPLITIPRAHHHLFLDQPFAFVETVRRLLADWGHSDPERLPASESKIILKE
jgi:pimeloyl-ACP methyl ester carboxylesterase